MIRPVSVPGQSLQGWVPISQSIPSAAEVKARLQGAPTIGPRDSVAPGTVLSRDGRPYATSPNIFVAADRTELRILFTRLQLAARELGYDNPELSEQSVAHEAQHADVAKALGAFAGYALRVAWHVDGSQRMLAHQVSIAHRDDLSRIEKAAILAAPTSLSPTDVTDLQKLRFSSQREVAEAIAAHNRIHPEKLIPLPIPFQRDAVQLIRHARTVT